MDFGVIKPILIERMRRAVSGMVSVDVSIRHDEFLECFVLQLSQKLLVDGFETVDVEEKWPADWWQACKERWLPNWLVRRFPVKYRTLSIHRKIPTRMCPHIRTYGVESHVQFLINKPP